MAERVEEIIRATLELGDDVVISPDANLVSEIGLDSIEAFESVAALHEILGARIPDDLDPKVLGTIREIAAYMFNKYDAEKIDAFMEIDIAARIASMRNDDELA